MTHSEETKRAAVAAYKDGLTAAEVAEELIVHPTSVLAWCRARGVPIRSQGGSRARHSVSASSRLGRLIQGRRMKLELTLRDLSRLTRCSAAQINGVELGNKGLGLRNASKLAAALDIPLQDLADAAELDAKEKEGAS